MQFLKNPLICLSLHRVRGGGIGQLIWLELVNKNDYPGSPVGRVIEL